MRALHPTADLTLSYYLSTGSQQIVQGVQRDQREFVQIRQ